MKMDTVLKLIAVGLLVSFGVFGCALGGYGDPLTAEEYRQLARDLEGSARELEAVNWYGAEGSRFKYEEISGGSSGLLDMVGDGHRLAIARLDSMEARLDGVEWAGSDRDLGETLEAYFQASRSFYTGLDRDLDYFKQISDLLAGESEVRQAYYLAPMAGDEAAVGETYRQKLSGAIDKMRAMEAPVSLKGLHENETEWLEARLDHLNRSRAAGEGGDDKEVSQLIDEKAAEWTAFGQAFEELELQVAEESPEARAVEELERLLGQLQKAVGRKL